MTTKAEFNADEWAKVVHAPLLAGVRVAMAERGGTIRESIAMGKAYQEARGRQGDSELLDELVSSPPSLDPSMFPQGGGSDVGASVRDRIQEAVRLVEGKATPEETAAYKDFLIAIAQTVASASKEGGFLGIGGKDVSPAEQEAIDDLSAALG